MTESNTDNLGGASVRNAGQGAGAPMVNGVGVAPNNVGMAPMAEVNLKPKRRGWMQNKLVLLAAGGVLAVLVLVIVGVVIGVNKGKGEESVVSDDTVRLRYELEGYGDDLSDSVVVAVFDDEIKEKLRISSGYAYEDAIEDYNRAYAESDGQLRLEVALAYAKFVFEETGDADEAVKILSEKTEVPEDEFDIVRYYTTIASIYEKAGQLGQAKYYDDVLNELTQSWLADENSQRVIMGGEQ